MTAVPPDTNISGWERRQLRRLRNSRAVATGLLALAAAVFAATLVIREPVLPYLVLLRSIAEAALVGGLADWFAVTALFRRPLGLPIPHTAILPANKERIGEGLARFLDRHFLTPELLLPEIRALRVSECAATWLARRRNAQALANEIAKALPHLLHAVDDRQIAAFLRRAFGAQLRQAKVASLAGRLLQIVAAAGYHEAVLDTLLDYARDFLERNRESLLEAAGERRRGWVPRAINREIARAMLRGASELVADLRTPGSAVRRALIEGLGEFAEQLSNKENPELFSASPRALLNRPELRAWIAASWESLRNLLLRDLKSPSSRTRRTIALMIASAGEALRADAAMRERLDANLEAVVLEALPWRAELIRFVSAVVRDWEPRSFSDRIEAAVGADLQYIRMNGTIVGGLVGGVLYLISLLAH